MLHAERERERDSLEVSVHAGMDGQAMLVSARFFRVDPRAPDPRAPLKGRDGEEGLPFRQVSYGTQPRRSRSHHRHSDRHSDRWSAMDTNRLPLIVDEIFLLLLFFRMLSSFSDSRRAFDKVASLFFRFSLFLFCSQSCFSSFFFFPDQGRLTQ